MNIGIIGGGIAGLTAAYELGKQGHRVTVFEKNAHLGGQVATFEIGGERLEGFYHHIFAGDVDILNLMAELGLSDRLLWLESKVGFWCQEKIYDFVTPFDLLRFKPIGFLDRIRLGLVTLYLQRFKNWRSYEGITAREWITKYAGRRNYDVVWGPLLRGKFGQSSDEVGMVWFWGKIYLRFASRSKGMGQERLGYLKGSFGLVIDALAQRISNAGGTIYTDAPVSRIVIEQGKATAVEVGQGDAAGLHPFDAIIATVPSPTFLDLVPQMSGDYAEKLKKTRYQAALCLVLTLNRPLSSIYWLNISDASIPFVAAIEHTNFTDSSTYGGKHILYLSNYLAQDSPLYRASVDELLAAYLPHLKRFNPEFGPDWIEDRHLFRDDAGQPIVGINYSRQIPEHQTPIEGLYLANTTQIYPEDRGMNYSVRLGTTVSKIMPGT
ncbi:MAG: NAD(P)/FAD-dependent oxidoreductase [Chloroflexota bacterium]|nr:NAD(P)/FAD-dependent oxidoreductase [Chloroflexota bacterium]